MDKKKLLIIVGSIIAVITAIIIVLLMSNKKPITYNVSFETSGGSYVESQIVNEGEKVKKPQDPTKKGYIFVEWVYEGDLYDFSLKVTSDIILTAKWIEAEEDVEKYIVKFNSDGGTTISNQIIEKGNKVAKPIDPEKEGHTFKGWILNDELYDFEKIVENDLELKAKWEKDKNSNNNVVNPSNNNNNSNNTKPNNNSNNSSNNNQNVEPPKNEVKLTTPTITKGGYGADGEGTVGMELKLNSTDGITGVEIYSSTTENGTYTLQKTVKKEDWNSSTSSVYAQKGQHLYFKVRTYVKNSAGTYYSGYSNVLELNNPLATPTITRGGYGADVEGTVGMELKLNSTDGITGVEIYSSTTENGTYTLQKTVKKEDWNSSTSSVYAQKGQHLYFKVRTYVKNSAGTYYSGYSNVLELNNPLATPTITRGGYGADGEGTVGMELKLNSTDGITGVEIYSSTTENGTYTLQKTVKKEDWNSSTSSVYAQKGQHLYFKVRTYVKNSAGIFYSGYSNVLELNNSN